MPRPRTIEDQALLSKAMLVFWRNGYARTGIRELEQALGLKAPSLYHRFGSKDALFQAALGHYLEAVVRARIRRYLETSDALQGLREFFDSTYETLGGKTSMGCLLVNTSLEAGTDAPPAAAAPLIKRGSLMIRAGLRAALRRAQQEGALRRDADPRALSDVLFLGLQGLLVESRVVSERVVLRRRTDALFGVLPVITRKD
jgi:TetR/AcrR family transcriptional regulator, transcriptional repressor for nem operon